MTQPSCAAGGYCDRCDLLVDLPGLHVIGVEHDTVDRVVVTVESAPGPIGCPAVQWSRPGTAALFRAAGPGAVA